MSFPTINISLGGGELSPEVRGRIDVEKIGTGAAKLRNFYVRTSGGITGRTGLEHVIHTEITDETTVSDECRLIPFRYNIEETYMLMFQDRIVRFIKDGNMLFDITYSLQSLTSASPAVATRNAALDHELNQNDEIQIIPDYEQEDSSGLEEIEWKYFRVDLILDAAKTITGATKADPVVLTVTGHGYSTGDVVYITNVAGMTQLNKNTYRITVLDPNTFELNNTDGTNFTTYVSGGNCQKADKNDFQIRGLDTTAYTYAGNNSLFYRRIYEVETPYQASQVDDIDYTQSNDVLTLVHPSHPQADLNRYGEFDWRYEIIDIQPTISAPGSVLATYTGTGTGIAYAYRVTAFNKDTGEESIVSASSVIASGDLSTSGDKCVITWAAVSDADTYNIYRADDGSEFYGFIGSASALTFTDRNILPDFSDSPSLSTRDPFFAADKYPSVVQYHQSRRWYASSNDFPLTVWGSVSGNFNNFNVSAAVKADDSITATLAAKEANKIQAMVPLGQMLIFTSGSEWLLKSSGTGDLITPETVSFEVQGYWGSMPRKPIVIGNSALFVTGNTEVDNNNSKFTMVRDLQYEFQADKYVGNDLTVLATHLFLNKEVVDWHYAQTPHSLVWCVRDDGICLSMTYVAEHEIFAWSTHDIDGKFEKVAAVREGGEDAVYFVTRRVFNGVVTRAVERLHTSQFEEVEDFFGVDAGVTFEEKVNISSIVNSNPIEITFTENLVDRWRNGDTIEFSDMEGLTTLNGNKYLIKNLVGGTLELTDLEGNDIDATGFDTWHSTEGGFARRYTNKVRKLHHLEGQSVVALADGNVLDPMTVTNGEITLPDTYSRVHVGFNYNCDFATIDANVGDKSGILYGTKRKVDAVTFRFWKTVGGEVGSSSDKLYPIKWRKNEYWGEPGALTNGDIYAQVHSRYGRVAQTFYRQPNPLPVTILSVVPEVSKGDD